MIKLAKLNENHLTELTQVIYYGDNENSDDWKLLELNEPLLSAIEEGQVLAFKGIFIHRQIFIIIIHFESISEIISFSY